MKTLLSFVKPYFLLKKKAGKENSITGWDRLLRKGGGHFRSLFRPRKRKGKETKTLLFFAKKKAKIFYKRVG